MCDPQLRLERLFPGRLQAHGGDRLHGPGRQPRPCRPLHRWLRGLRLHQLRPFGRGLRGQGQQRPARLFPRLSVERQRRRPAGAVVPRFRSPRCGGERQPGSGSGGFGEHGWTDGGLPDYRRAGVLVQGPGAGTDRADDDLQRRSEHAADRRAGAGSAGPGRVLWRPLPARARIQCGAGPGRRAYRGRNAVRNRRLSERLDGARRDH